MALRQEHRQKHMRRLHNRPGRQTSRAPSPLRPAGLPRRCCAGCTAITGQDLIAQLSGRELGEELLLSCSMLRSGEQVFLDDVTVEDPEKALQIRVRIVESSGYDFVRAVTGLDLEEAGKAEEELNE